MIDDRQFFAWLDGELSSEEGAAVEREVAANPTLLACANEHRAMQKQLKRAFDEVADASVPKQFTATLRQDSGAMHSVAMGQRQRNRTPLASRQWMAMAATLAVGFFMGVLVELRSSTQLKVEEGRIYAASNLASALDTQLASAQPTSSVHIGLTFRDQTGVICRTFIETRSSGLACRDGNGWQVRGLFPAPEKQSTDYRMAGGMDPNLAGLVDASIVGEPFDAANENATMKKGWK